MTANLPLWLDLDLDWQRSREVGGLVTGIGAESLRCTRCGARGVDRGSATSGRCVRITHADDCDRDARPTTLTS